MKINNINTQNTPSFKGILNNKLVLNSLEKISEHGTTFIAATTLLMASAVRPVVISKTPNVDKENKKYSIVNSIASGLVKFLMVESVALPIENAVKKIDKNPLQYLSQQTVTKLSEGSKSLADSKSYQFASQMIKLGTGLITAIPKSVITIALIPVITDLLFKKDKQNPQNKNQKQISFNAEKNSVFAPFFEQTNSPSFKGGLTDTAAKGIGKLFNNNKIQELILKHCNNNENIARNISMATDVLLTASFVHRTKKSKKIENNRRNVLIYNNIISTAISLMAGYSIDKLVKANTKKFIDKFAQINKNDPKLPKYIEGINIVRPTLIFAVIYYGLLPMFSTYMADKIEKHLSKTQDKKSI